MASMLQRMHIARTVITFSDGDSGEITCSGVDLSQEREDFLSCNNREFRSPVIRSLTMECLGRPGITVKSWPHLWHPTTVWRPLKPSDQVSVSIAVDGIQYLFCGHVLHINNGYCFSTVKRYNMTLLIGNIFS